MANYRAIATGNWSNGATWAGGSVPPNGEGHNVYSNNFTVTIDTNVNVALITNSAITASFVGGGTSAAAGGSFNAAGAYTLNVALITASSTSGTVNNTGTSTLNINGCTVQGNQGGNIVNIRNTSTGNITFDNCVIAANGSSGGAYPIINVSTGTLTFNTCTMTAGPNISYAVGNLGAGNIIVSGGVLNGAPASTAPAITSTSTGSVTCSNCTINAGASAVAINNGAGQLTLINCVVTASNGANGVTSAGVARISGTLISSPNGFQAVNSSRWILNTSPTASYIQQALDGINANSYVRFYTADNALGQANPTDVRSGVSYASGNLTGRLTVPARGSVALSVNYGPSMPFTATRSGTTATATLSYSYPLVVGDEFTVTGASNSEWNSTYTIASVVSGTAVTFTVPNTHSAAAGTGALMQTTGTAVLDPAAVASAVWGAATRTITGGLVDTATTLTNSPDVPTESEIAAAVRTELDSNSTKLANLDASISSRLAGSAYTAPANSDISAIKSKTDNIPASPAAVSDIPTAAQISAAVEGSLLNEGDGQAVLNAIVGAIGNTNLSEVSLVAAVRADLERSGGKLDSIPTTSAPTAAQNASAVWGAATRSVTGGTVDTLTNAPASVTPSDIWSHSARTLTSASGPTAAQIRQEMDSNSTQLSAIKLKTDNLPSDPADQSLVEAAIAGITAPSASTVAAAVRSELSSELSKVSALNTERLANVATTAIVGNLISQANS
jgi:hypothetical protein